MPGQHIDRGGRAEKTGVTEAQRDQLILRMHGANWSQRKIAKALGMTQPGVKYAIDRLTNKQRVQVKRDICDDCGQSWPKNDIVEGLCPECQ